VNFAGLESCICYRWCCIGFMAIISFQGSCYFTQRGKETFSETLCGVVYCNNGQQFLINISDKV